MAYKTKHGFIAPIPDDFEYIVQEIPMTRSKKEKFYNPTGVFISGSPRSSRISMHYAGVDTTMDGFQLPDDPDFLRDIADALRMLADEIEQA